MCYRPIKLVVSVLICICYSYDEKTITKGILEKLNLDNFQVPNVLKSFLVLSRSY
jgi:hypothetical protein